MPTSVLVVYATRAGSTKEVAEAVASAFRDAGLAVDIRPLREAKTLEGYQAVVMGAPFYMFRWHKDALRFLKRHQKALENRPVAVFALGPFNDVEKEWNDVRAQLDKALAGFPWLKPVATEVFGGKFDPVTLPSPYNLIPAMKKLPASDLRDWEAIANWAQELAAEFSGGRPPTSD